MKRSKLATWLMTVVCLIGGASGQAAFAHGGGGGGHGGGGHGGGGHMGGGHMGGGHMGGGHTGGGGYGHSGYGGGYGGGFYPGIGFWGGGLGYYGSGYGSGYGYGYNSPNYYTQPSVQSYPVYTISQPVIAMPAGAADGGEVVLFSPANNTSDMQFTLNGTAYVLKPGEFQKFKNDRLWTIEFASASNGQSALRYTLMSHTYKFKPSDSGMGLFQTQDSPDTPMPATSATAPTPVPNPPN